MQITTRAVLVTAFLCLFAVPAVVAQEKGQIGVTIAYPASAGIVWHATDRIGLRTTIDFSHASHETTIGPQPVTSYTGLDIPLPSIPSYSTESSATTFSFTFAGLLYLSKADGVSTYVSPRYSILHVSYDLDANYGILSLPLPDSDADDSETSGAFGGFFGVQYAPVRRFSAFAEVGLEYYSHDDDDRYGRSESSITSLTAGIGVTFYFK